MRVTINDIRKMKTEGQKISMVTAYDYTSAKILDKAGVPIILVGDTLGQVVLGYDSTIPVTMEDMIHHTKAVRNGSEAALIVGDMPFMSYQASIKDAMYNAGRFLKEGGAQSVKLEGGMKLSNTVRQLVDAGIPVMGHIGLTPQSVNQLGGYKVQGKSLKEAIKLLEDARSLEESGAFCLVLECVPTLVARLITERLSIPTIGIGAGIECDGQVQVFHDMLGLFTDFTPKHAKRYLDLDYSITTAVTQYMKEVRDGDFPGEDNSYHISDKILRELTSRVY